MVYQILFYYIEPNCIDLHLIILDRIASLQIVFLSKA